MTFYFEPTGVLAERVQPTHGARRREYVHRCTREVFEEVCHRVDEQETFTLEELLEGRDLPNSQAALALRLLHEYGLVEKIHSRRCWRTENSIHLSAMTCWYGLLEGAEA